MAPANEGKAVGWPHMGVCSAFCGEVPEPCNSKDLIQEGGTGQGKERQKQLLSVWGTKFLR